MEINIEELHGQIGSRRMLAKGPIICQPDSVAELLICAKYQQLILSDLNLSTDAEMEGQRNGVNRHINTEDFIDSSFQREIKNELISFE